MNILLKRCTKPQAELLKKHGYNLPCNRYYKKEDSDTRLGAEMDHNYYDQVCSAPFVAEALEWYRQVKSFKIAVTIRAIGLEKLGYFGEAYCGRNTGCILTDSSYESYQECESALLDKIQQLKFD